MKMIRLTGIAIVLALSGCANLQAPLPPETTAEAGSAYLAGTFYRAGWYNYAFLIRAANGAEYNLSLGPEGRDAKTNGQTLAIKVPPGVYAVTHWFTFDPTFKERSNLRPMSNEILNRPFTVSAGQVLHLGSFQTNQSFDSKALTYIIQPQRVSQGQMQEAFKKHYPKLAHLPFNCLLCIDTVDER